MNDALAPPTRFATTVGNGPSTSVAAYVTLAAIPVGVTFTAAELPAAFATVTTPPARFITLAKGGSAQGESGCVSARCAFMVVTGSAGINPNAIVRCYSTDFGDFGVTITFSRYNQVNNTCYYGGFGRAWIEADGVRSNEVPW